MELPRKFEERMKGLLGGEYAAFRESFERKPCRGLRVNTLRIGTDEFLKISPWSLCPVPWTASGFYYAEDDHPGRSALHEAGLCYIQEPSAMAVAELAAAALGTSDGERFSSGPRILDLCAAPGGKTTQIAALFGDRSLLVSNEIHPARARILSSNVERMGIRNAVVINETPERISERFPGFFDLVICDAPCSGEGMMRRDEEAIRQWSAGNVEMCAGRQHEILDRAAAAVRPGGLLVYSTCTFAPEEDERSVEDFIRTHEDFSLMRIEGFEMLSEGRPEWTDGFLSESALAFRIWPHLLEGEGHFAAVMKKEGDVRRASGNQKSTKRAAKGAKPAKAGAAAGHAGNELLLAISLYRRFADECLPGAPDILTGTPVLFGENLYLSPAGFDAEGLKVLRPGLHLGTARKGRFEPSHALSHVLDEKDAENAVSFPQGSTELLRYIRGESLESGKASGWTLVCVEGRGIGWGKVSEGVLKNHYPKGLRRG